MQKSILKGVCVVLGIIAVALAILLIFLSSNTREESVAPLNTPSASLQPTPPKTTAAPTATPRPTDTPRPQRTTRNTLPTDNDPYDAKNYAHADDFYYDYYDDFFDYEDAEEYYDSYN